MNQTRRAVLAGAVGAATLGGLGVVLVSRRGSLRASGADGCGPALTRSDLDTAIELGADYLVGAMRPDGDFVYEVDWRTGRESREDNVVRQSGATWGLGLLHQDGMQRATAPLDRSLGYWLARMGREGDRAWIRGGRRGQTGALALVGLSLVERLRAPTALEDGRRAEYEQTLDGIIASILAARLPDGGFASNYDPETGAFSGAANPYADGEALLLLSKAGIHLGRDALLPEALAVAQRDHQRNVADPLASEPDPDTTKGYYQWGSMSWFELASAGHAPERHGGWLIALAVWMVEVHRTLQRTRNTGYAYEGILSAQAWAARSGDAERSRELACVAHQGLRKLFSWQLGHPLAPEALRTAPEQFRGGVQNTRDEPALRIDVTQHQTHAAVLARRFGIDEAELPG